MPSLHLRPNHRARASFSTRLCGARTIAGLRCSVIGPKANPGGEATCDTETMRIGAGSIASHRGRKARLAREVHAWTRRRIGIAGEPLVPDPESYSGLKKTAPSGGSVMLIECRRPFHGIGLDSTLPRLPCPLPPSSLASLFKISRQRPADGTPTRYRVRGCGREVERHEDDVALVVAPPQEGQDALLRVASVDPLEPARLRVASMQRGLRPVDMVERADEARELPMSRRGRADASRGSRRGSTRSTGRTRRP